MKTPSLGGGAKKALLSKLLDSPAATNLTQIIASVEHELLTTAAPLDESMGTGHIGDVPDVENRQEALLGLLEGVINGSMQDVWTDQILPEVVDSPHRAERYVGMDADEWARRKAGWAENYREQGATGGDDALAEYHVENVWGVSLETFEDRVVGFEDGKEAERLFAANFRAVRDVLDAAADEVGE